MLALDTPACVEGRTSRGVRRCLPSVSQVHSVQHWRPRRVCAHAARARREPGVLHRGRPLARRAHRRAAPGAAGARGGCRAGRAAGAGARTSGCRCTLQIHEWPACDPMSGVAVGTGCSERVSICSFTCPLRFDCCDTRARHASLLCRTASSPTGTGCMRCPCVSLTA